MDILFFSHYFPPEGNAPATRTYENCRRWVQQGHHVTVVTCAPNHPLGQLYEGYTNRLYHIEELEGIRVIRVWTYLAANKGTTRRIANYLSYLLSALLGSIGTKTPDIVIATSPQFFCGWTGVLSRWLRRVPFVLEIRDIWPDSIQAVGALDHPQLIRILHQLEAWMYQSAHHIVTVGEGYKQELLQKGVPTQKISVIPNGANLATFQPRPPDLELKRQLGISQPIVCSYVGTIGMACGLEVVLKTARILKQKGREDIAIVLIGEGALREQLQQSARQEGLEQIIFTGLLDKSLIPSALSFSDISLVHLKKTPLFQTVLPSKIFEAAAMEKPIIMGVQGEASSLIQCARAGLCIEPENPQELTDALLHLADDPQQRERYGKQGRAYIKQHYDRDKLAQTYLKQLRTVIKQFT